MVTLTLPGISKKPVTSTLAHWMACYRLSLVAVRDLELIVDN